MNIFPSYAEGSMVISPYGLAVIDELFAEPLHERPSRSGEQCWPTGQERPDFGAARIFVNGHGEETIELDQLVPATPTTMALWNFLATEYEQPTTGGSDE